MGLSEVVRAARRVAFQVQPEKIEEFRRTARNEVAPKISRESGFRRLFVVQSKTNPSEVVAFSLWNHDEDIEAYEKSGHAAENLSVVRPYITADSVVSRFRVLEHFVGVQFKKTPIRPKAKKRPVKRKRRR